MIAFLIHVERLLEVLEWLQLQKDSHTLERPSAMGYNRGVSAPVAQWIERCPPEADAGVRVAAGV
jgi:hypothetical protein